jgi:hypothetical protein
MKLLGFSGKKDSGKDTLVRYIVGRELQKVGKVIKFEVSENTNGQLLVDVYNGVGENEFDIQQGILNLYMTDKETLDFFKEYCYPYVRVFGFADKGKTFLNEFFGISREKMYGTNKEKDELSSFNWEQLPASLPKGEVKTIGRVVKKTGPMTYREVMEEWLQIILRGVDEKCHINATFSEINQSNTKFAIIKDVRNENEIDAIQSVGGKVIRLLKDSHGSTHEGEISLDNYDPTGYDYVLNNMGQTLEETIKELEKVLTKWGW